MSGTPPRAAEPAASDSQARLAASIVRELRSHLPGLGSDAALVGSVEEALADEARGNELTLAYLRAAVLAAFALLSALLLVRPGLVEADRFGGGPATSLALFAAAAAAFAWALRNGWYHPRLRQVVPAADALAIGASVLLLPAGQGMDAIRPGAISLTAGMCMFLVFSGALRFSRSSQRIATTLAVVVWLVVAWQFQLRPVAAAFIVVLLVATGVFGGRLARVVRRVIREEVARSRLDQLYHDAQAGVEAREEVLRIVAHDLRNPLSTIRMAADVLLEMDGDQAFREKHLAVIRRCTGGMDRLIHDLLDVARMEAGRLRVEPRPVPVATLLEQAAEQIRPLASEASIRVEVVDAAGAASVHADADRVAQVFSNLGGNAVKFTPEGGAVTLSATPLGDAVRFAVVDTGPGIAPEQAELIFERFWQGRATDRRGIGLGLAIARSIVEAHGGRIGATPAESGGAEFWFTLPTAPAA